MDLSRVVERMPLLAAVAGLLVLLGGSTVPSARAETRVSAAYGAIAVRSQDSAPHDLHIWVSDVDRGDETFPLPNPKAQVPDAAGAAGDLFNAADQTNGATLAADSSAVEQQLDNFQTSSERLDTLSHAAIAGSVSSMLLNDLKALTRRMLDAGAEAMPFVHALDRKIALRDRAAINYAQAVAVLGENSDEAETLAEIVADAQKAVRAASLDLYSALPNLTSAEVALTEKIAEVEKATLDPHLAKAIWAEARELRITSNGFISRAVRAMSQVFKELPSKSLHGFVFAVGLGAALYALSGKAEADVQSERRVIIQDEGSVPLSASSDCSDGVRLNDGRQLDNAVSCPLPQQPDWVYRMIGYLLDGRIEVGSGINVTMGSGNDAVDVDIPNDVPVPYLNVDGRAGDDRISTPRAPAARIIGGRGRDVIETGSGDDTVWGDDPLDTTQPTDPDSNSDTIITADGDDSVYAQQGNNFVAAGRGDDNVYAGDGSNTLDGGAGADQIVNGRGPVYIVATEMSGEQTIDPMIDCGPGGGKKFALLSPPEVTDAGGQPEAGVNCSDPVHLLTFSDLKAQYGKAPPVGGNWPWLG